jgi:adenylate cyclase
MRKILHRAGGWRMLTTALFLAAALLVARDSWSIVLLQDVERVLYDVRAVFAAPKVDQDPRIVMVVYTDRTLELTGKRSPLDRALLAKALTNIDRLRPKAIGIDILIDQPQPEDPQLIGAFRAIRSPTWLAFAANETNASSMQTWQEDYLRGFLDRVKPGNVHPASIRIEADPDNVMRSWPSQPAGLPPLLVRAMAARDDGFQDYHGGIRYRLPDNAERPVFNSLSIELFENPAMAEALKDQIAGKFVLIGGDISDVDQFETPATRITGATTTGLEIHANLLVQLLDHVQYSPTSSYLLWLAAILVVLAACATAMLDMRTWLLALLLAGQAVLLLALPFALRMGGIDTQDIPAFGWLLGWIISFAAAGSLARSIGSDQRRFAQSALGKYLPRDIANAILRDPERLSLSGEKREIVALFSDLEGFTKLSHSIEPEMVALLLNTYLDRLSNIVLEHGGTIDKFVGDAVVAFWGAPIARPDDADRAAQAALAIFLAGEAFRLHAPPEVPPLGRTRVGVYRGEAIVGNFGGEGRFQYTALGDSMNAAARLESANKPLGTRILISESAARGVTSVSLRPMGRISVRGRTTPITIFEAMRDDNPEDVTLLTTLLDRFDKGDDQAIKDLQAHADAKPDDAALKHLIYRLKSAGSGGSFALD